MTGLPDDALDRAAAAAGRRYGLTASEVLQRIALGDHRHPDARPDECGDASPKNDTEWCRRPPGHTGDHDPVASPPGDCGVLLNPPDPYVWCHRTPGHTGAHTVKGTA